MMRKVMLFSFCFVLMIGTASADQAAWIGKTEAYKAGGMINPGMELRRFCVPCGDTTWTVLTVNQVEVRNASGQNYQVFVNGTGLDLAYIYLSTKGRWKNLAMVLGLSVSGVPEFLSEDKAPASGTNNNPIDRQLSECMDKDPSTAGTTNCIYEAYEMWDDELNRVYKKLRKRLSPEGQKALKAAQLTWISYRDKEFELISSIYAGLEGTMYRPMQVGDRMEIVKKRALELRAYLDLLENH